MVWRLTKWFRILSRMTWTISNDCIDATEYTRTYPWIPMKCFELRILYSSLTTPNRISHVWCGMGSLMSTHLASGIYDLSCELLPFKLDDFAESIFNGRVITLNEVPIDELNRQRRFPYEQSAPTETVRAQIQLPTDREPTIAILRCLGGAGGIFMAIIWSLFTEMTLKMQETICVAAQTRCFREPLWSLASSTSLLQSSAVLTT